MSCEAHRGKYFQHLAENVPDVNAQDLEKLYQAATNRPNEAMAEVVELKTRMLFNDMQQVGLKPPTHSPTGLPKKKSQHGYAAVFDFLKGKGHFDPKKKKRQAEENGGKSGAKNGPLPPQKFKAAVAEHLQAQQATANGHATKASAKNETENPPEKAHSTAPAREEAVVSETKPALSLVGMEEEDNREHAARFPVWKHVPRCGKCGRWMSTQNPVCQNPKCGMRGETQGVPVPWPPPGANFKRSGIQAQPSARPADLPASVPPTLSTPTRKKQATQKEPRHNLPWELQITNLPEGGLRVARGEAQPVEIRREANGRYVAFHQPDPEKPAQRSHEAETPEALMAWAKNVLNIHALAQPQVETDTPEDRASQGTPSKVADQLPLQTHEVGVICSHLTKA
ncbi:MAG TPA: hypothetical protein PK530_23915, partial [Anaerolineales bacterium]|nr:hypothetical protein [Anaerolineales bacterium]